MAGDLGADLQSVLENAPEMANSPELAVAAAQSPDPAGTAQGLGYATDQAALGQAAQQATAKHGSSWWQTALHWAGTAGGDVLKYTGAQALMNAANKPLQEVTHQYRYLHDVEARHGAGAALIEGLSIGAGAIAGGAIGAALGGIGTEPAAILGGELTGEALGHTVYTDSWERTKPGYRDPNTGNAVSPGRDLVSWLGGSNGFWTSGLVDAAFDVEADPLGKLGKIADRAATAKLVLRGDTIPERAADVERVAATSGRYQRWASQVAGMDAGTIAARYPFVGTVLPAEGETMSLASRLGDASTADEVTDVMRNAVGAREMLGQARMPGIQLNRVPFQKINEAILNYDGPGADALDAVRSRFTSTPMFHDLENKTFTNSYMDPASPQASNLVYHEMRFGFDDPTAREVANQWENAPTLADKLMIRKNGIVNMMIHMGMPEDGQLIQRLRASIDEAQGVGQEGQYGTDVEGRNLSKITDGETSRTTPAAILQSQRGTVPLLDYQMVRKQIASLNAASKALNGTDEFLFNHFTGTVFKPLVLLSGGTAERMALSEAIPAGLRLGFKNMVQSSIAAHLASYGAKAADEELPWYQQAVYRALGGDESKLVNADRVDAAVKAQVATGGYMIDPSLDASHARTAEQVGKPGAAADTLFRAGAQAPQNQLGDKWTLFGHDSSDQADRWQRWLSSIAKDAPSRAAADAYARAAASGASMGDATQAGADAATDWLRRQSDTSLFLRSRARPTGTDPLEDWGRTVMENVKGATHTPRVLDEQTGNIAREATPHGTLLNNVATGKVTNQSFLDAIPVEDRPLAVPGRETVIAHEGTIDKLASFGWKRLLGPIINNISRTPMWNAEFYDSYTKLKPLVESGSISDEEAVQGALQQATENSIKFVHNPHDRSQFAQMTRNLMPFYFAQTQAYRRFGRLLDEDPEAFRRMMMLTSSISNPGHTVTDASGKSYMVYPGSGFLGTTAANTLGMIGANDFAGSVPVSFSGQLRSINTVLPFSEGIRPSFGPVVGIASKALMGLFPELTPQITNVIGPQQAAGGIVDQLIPNQTLKNLWNTFAPGSSGARSYQNAEMSVIQALAYRQDKAMAAWVAAGHQPTDVGAPDLIPNGQSDTPTRQQFIDRVRNQTRILFLLKTVMGATAPMAPVVNIGDMGLKAELRANIAKDGLAKGLDEFLTKNPDATAYTVFDTKAADGSDVPATAPGMDWYNQNAGFVSKYSRAAAWLVPQVPAAFDQAAYNEQMATHLRLQKAPTDFLNDVYTAAGNAQYFNHDLPAYKAAEAQVANDPSAKAELSRQWNDYLANQLGKQNPTWWDDFKSVRKTTDAQQAVADMLRAQQAGDLPQGPQTDLVTSLLTDFKTYQQNIAIGRTDPGAVASNASLKKQWQDYVDGVAKDHPELAPVIQKVFRRL